MVGYCKRSKTGDLVRRRSLEEHIVYVGQARDPQNILVENCEGRFTAVIHVCSWKDNLKADIRFDGGCRAMAKQYIGMRV